MSSGTSASKNSIYTSSIPKYIVPKHLISHRSRHHNSRASSSPFRDSPLGLRAWSLRHCRSPARCRLGSTRGTRSCLASRLLYSSSHKHFFPWCLRAREQPWNYFRSICISVPRIFSYRRSTFDCGMTRSLNRLVGLA